MHKLKLLTALVLVFSAAAPVTASTTIPGGVIGDSETWTPAGSPYILQGDVIVAYGVGSLTIEAGTVVQVAAGDSQQGGVDIYHTELGIAGTLIVNGTAANPVVFEPQNPVNYGDWSGIIVYPAASSVVVNFANVTNASRGIQSSAAGTLLQISNSTFSHSNVGIDVVSGSPLIDAVNVEGCYEGILVEGDAGGTISNAVLRNNINIGLNFNQTVGPGSPLLLTHTTIYGGYAGIALQTVTAEALTVENSIITQTQVGLEVSFGNVSILSSNVYGNQVDYYGATAGPGSISADPLFVSAPDDLHLLPESPSINSASATNASDHDRDGVARPSGAGYDMGAYESTDVLLRNGFE